MATSKNNSSRKNSGDRHNATRTRCAEPARSAPDTERGLTHSPYFNGLLYKRSPDQITEDQLREFFLHLRNDREFASGSLRVAYSGIKFFYTRTCKRNWETLAQMRIKDCFDEDRGRLEVRPRLSAAHVAKRAFGECDIMDGWRPSHGRNWIA